MEEIKLKTKSRWKKSNSKQNGRNQTQNKIKMEEIKLKTKWKKSNSK